MAEKVRIKDIAQRAGVSVGTVDRVIHGRPNVSPVAKQKIEQALKDMNYRPNVYASALASNKKYNFIMLLPKHAKTAYWEEIEEGAQKAVSNYSDFNINMQILYYDRYDVLSFHNMTAKCKQIKPQGVIIVPTDLASTREYTNWLHDNYTPFVMLDSFMPDLRPLAFFGQDSFSSGFFAGKMLMMMSGPKCEKVMVMRPLVHGRVPSKQQANREEGFRHYMIDHYPEVQIINLDLMEDTPRYASETYERFLKENPDVKTCITFSSGVYVMGEYLTNNNIRDIQVMGYDMTPRNEQCLRNGTITFLIAQHGYRQGYYCLKTLFDAVVLQKSVKEINYMPIELICKENADFYQRYEL